MCICSKEKILEMKIYKRKSENQHLGKEIWSKPKVRVRRHNVPLYPIIPSYRKNEWLYALKWKTQWMSRFYHCPKKQWSMEWWTIWNDECFANSTGNKFNLLSPLTTPVACLISCCKPVYMPCLDRMHGWVSWASCYFLHLHTEGLSNLCILPHLSHILLFVSLLSLLRPALSSRPAAASPLYSSLAALLRLGTKLMCSGSQTWANRLIDFVAHTSRFRYLCPSSCPTFGWNCSSPASRPSHFSLPSPSGLDSVV